MGAPALPKIERVVFAEIADALVQDYTISGKRDLRDVGLKLAPVPDALSKRTLSECDANW